MEGDNSWGGFAAPVPGGCWQPAIQLACSWRLPRADTAVLFRRERSGRRLNNHRQETPRGAQGSDCRRARAASCCRGFWLASRIPHPASLIPLVLLQNTWNWGMPAPWGPAEHLQPSAVV